MFRVVWLQSALDELAQTWIDADSSLRTMITAAAEEIDRKLSDEPLSAGESREEQARIDFVYPLAITYEVDLAEQTATILHVRVYRRRAD